MLKYGELRTLARTDLVEAFPLAKPMSLYVEPTNICNLHCDFCPHDLKEYREKAGYLEHMEMSLFRRVMGEAAGLELKVLRLYFLGEPLSHPAIGEMVRLAHDVCPRVELTSNAILLTERKASELIEGGLDYLRVSYYGYLTSKLQEIVRSNVERLWRMRGEGKKPCISIKVFTQEEAESIRDLYGPVSDEIIVEEYHNLGSTFLHLGSLEGKKKACSYPFYNLVVKANGDVVPCCVAWEKSLVVGNVKESTLLEIWGGDRLAEIQRLHLEGRRGELGACANCNTLFLCPDSVDGLTVERFDQSRTSEDEVGCF